MERQSWSTRRCLIRSYAGSGANSPREIGGWRLSCSCRLGRRPEWSGIGSDANLRRLSQVAFLVIGLPYLSFQGAAAAFGVGPGCFG